MAFARNGEVEIFYETFGDPGRPALMLVNGLGSQCINYRVEWCGKFADAGHFVIRFDNRDVGLSTKFTGRTPDFAKVREAITAGRVPDVPYLLTDMADDAIAVLDALGIERAHVMGLSMGGMIVQTMAIEHPERVLTMTSIMSTTGDPDVGQPTDEARKHLLAPPAPDRDSYIANYIAGLHIWGSPACLDDERSAALAGEAYDRCFEPEGTPRQYIGVMASGSRTKALANIDVPTLVLHGDQDKLIDPSGGRRTADTIPGARFVLLEGMGHDYPPEYWDQIVELVSTHTHQAVS